MNGRNGNRYRFMLNEFLFTKIEEEDIGNTRYFAPCFGEGYQLRRWPPRSCDLTLLDYYLCGAVKDQYYANKLETIDVLKDNISEAIDEI